MNTRGRKTRERVSHSSCSLKGEPLTKTHSRHFFFKSLFTAVLFQWDISQGKIGFAFPRGKPAATESRYPTYGACWVFFSASIIHRTLTWTTWSLTCAQMLTYAITRGGVRTPRKRVCTESRLWEKNPLLHRGIESASAAWRSDALPKSYIPTLLDARVIPHTKGTNTSWLTSHAEQGTQQHRHESPAVTVTWHPRNTFIVDINKNENKSTKVTS